MNKHDATEIAYKNGYTQGRIDAVRKMHKGLKNKSVSISSIHGTAKMVNARWIDQIAKEMLEGIK